MANVKTVSGDGNFQQCRNTAYHCTYDFINNKLNAVNVVYKITAYTGSDKEHNYIFSTCHTLSQPPPSLSLEPSFL